MHNIVFWLFACIALIASLMVIIAKNPIRAVLSLIVTFFATAATWLVLDAEFLAITLVLVYVGAVMVLFLFVVMMLDINFATKQAKFSRLLPLGIFLSAVLFCSIINVLYRAQLIVPYSANILAYGNGLSNTAMLGQLVFTKYLLQFEIAGILLLVAIIAAIGLIYRGPRARKTQSIAQQISVQAADRVRLVDGI